ncbi:MAG: hypothetical protein PUB07_01810 [Clostridia bacterium]|nr:hypothetical protein [Clostridia bacterium]
MRYAVCAFFYISVGPEKNRAEWTNCAKAAGFGPPKAYIGTSRGEVCS